MGGSDGAGGRRQPTAETSHGRLLQVTAGVIARDDDILVCQRPAGGRHPGKWEFPGGKREGAEALPACLRRELSEELGIVAEVGALLWRGTHCYPGGQPFELFFYLVPSYRGVPVNRAFAEIRWARIGTLGALDFLDADRAFVNRLDRGEWNLEPRE